MIQSRHTWIICSAGGLSETARLHCGSLQRAQHGRCPEKSDGCTRSIRTSRRVANASGQYQQAGLLTHRAYTRGAPSRCQMI